MSYFSKICSLASNVIYFLSVQNDTKNHLTKSQDSSFKQILTSRMSNILDPDQLATKKPAGQDQQCFNKTGYIPVQHGKGKHRFR